MAESIQPVLPVDATPPTMICPGNISVNLDAGNCGAIVNYSLPVVYDNVGACSVASLPTFPDFTLLGQLNDKAYYLSAASATYAAATTAAQNIGGHLVAINSLEEQNYVRSLVPTFSIWLGLSDNVTEGNFIWASGEPLTYTNWFTGQPDNASNQDFVEMQTNGFWYDMLGTSSRRYVVEVSCITPVLTSGLPSGSAFPIGVTTVTFQATDLSGNTSSCSFTVTVLDNVPPVLVCPGNQSLAQAAGCAAVLPDYRGLVTAADNCSPAGSVVVTQTPAPGTSVTADQVITITATDASGSTGTCAFNVTLADQQPPSITCPGDQVVGSQTGLCGAVVNYSLPTISDNCHSCAPMTLPGYTYLGVFGGHTYFRSTTSSSWAAANASATSNGGHLLTISSAAENNFFLGLGQHWMGFTDELQEGVWVWVNNEPVVYTNWDSGEPNNLGGNQDFGLINWTTSNQWDDQQTANLPHILEFDCAATPVPPVLVSGLAPGNVFPVGTTLVTYSATDASGNSSQCSFNVTVTDTQEPVISCPSNITVNVGAGQCSADVSVPSPQNMTSIVSACTPIPAGGPCGVGVAQATTGLSIGTGQTYWYSSTGTLASLTMTGGTLRVCGALTLSALTFTSGSIFIEPGGSLTVNGGGTINLNGNCTIVNRGSCVINRSVTMQNANNLIANEGSNAVFNMNNASYTLTLNSNTSRFVNTGTATIRTVTVNNTPAGGICLGFNSTTQIANLTNNVTNSFSAPNGYACLRITGATVLNSALTNSSGLNVCRAAGSVVSGPGGFGSAVVTLNCGGCALQPAVNDNCPGVVLTNSFNGTGDASGTYPIGVTEVVWTATDAAGNSSTCTQTITVNDNQPPVVNCPGNINTANTQGQCGSFVTFEITATDNCGTTTITQTAGLPSGSLFPIGMTTNTYSVTDPSGNSTTCSFTVTVVDTEPPVAICQDASVTLGAFPTPTNGSISGIINTYTAVTALTASSATVASTTGFSVGQKVLLIQMQGAVIETANTSSFGNISSISQAGNYEFARISGISGSTITFSNPIANTYNTSGRVQLVTVPEYNNVTVTGQVNAQAWNGTTGGIIVFDALGTITMNAAINANGAGFRGGGVSTNFFTTCPNNTNFAFSGPGPNGGQKGEGISIITAAQSAGRGKAANGGGGGNEVNAGGAGGSNGGSGGTGGNEFATCNGALGGLGGAGLSSFFSQNKIFMGGGGGGGHQNNSVATAGANGGGIIIITAQSITSNANIISANGSNAGNAGNDGAGGGGAGGAVLLQVGAFDTPTTVQARGGSGGNASNSGGANGPGGGGGGGLIRHTGVALPSNLNTSVTGGSNGTSGGSARGSASGAFGTVSGNLQLPQSGPFVILSANLVNNGSGDNCSISSISVSPQGFDCSDIGPNTVTLTVTDVNGNSSTCTSIVNIVDGIAPTIACPSNINTTISPGTCSRSVSTPNPTTSDNCGVANLSWVLSGATADSSPVSGINNLGTFIFNVGVTTVTYTALDAFGNSSTCSFTVTVADNVAPVITCPPAATIILNTSCTASLPSYTGSAAVTDNCTAAGLITVVQSPAAGTVLSGAGTTVVTLTATDEAGNSSSCTFNVIRSDQTAPVITCPANATLTLNASCTVTLPSYTALAVVSDNCTAPGSITITQSPTAGTVVSGTGTTTVTLTATDAAGNASTCTFNVVRVDQTPPTITCPANQTIALNASCTATLPSYISSAVVTDNCTASGFIVIDQSPAAGTALTGPGTTVVTLTATDASGNVSSCTFNVVRADQTAPAISCPANTTIALNTSCSATLPSYITGATVSDNCSATGSIVITQSPVAGTVLSGIGTTVVTLTATDEAGNASNCTFDVVLEDQIAPSIICPDSQTIAFGAGCNFTLPSYAGIAVASDNCDTSLTITQSPAAGTVITGTATITLTATDDGGNSTSCTFEVIPSDQTAPGITCPANQTVAFTALCNYTLPDYTGLATSTDNCDASLTITQSPAAGTLITGTTTITLTATDDAGNSTSCTFQVIPTDQTPPAITCPADQTVAFTASCNFTLPDYTGLASAADNCDAGLTITQSPAAGTVITGSTTITLTATDDGGNSTSCTFQVIPTDQTAPDITCPTDQTVPFTTTCTYILLDYSGLAAAADNCDASLTISQSPAAGTVITGSTTITLTATDDAGNSTSCAFQVIPEDQTEPSITCPGNQAEAFTASCDYTLLNYTGLAITADNCDASVTVTQSPAAGTVITGATTITLTATDDAGNSASCTFEVIPTDQTAPSITCLPDQTVPFTAACDYTLLDYTGLAAAADNCDASLTITQSPAAGTIITGTTAITLTTEDDAGNSNSCTFLVIPTDQTAPVIVCPTNQVLPIDASCNAVIPDLTGLVTTSDICDAVVTLSQTPASGTIVNSTTTVTITATDDAGNTSSCAVDVIPADLTAPSIDCLDDQITALSASCDATVPDYTGLATAADNCSINVTITQSPAPGTVFSGTTSVTLTATDGVGNSTSCSFDLIAADLTAPSIDCPADQILSIDASCEATLPDYTGLASTDDNCDAFVTVTQLPAPGTLINGITAVILTAVDDAGNVSSCTFDVTPADQLAPGIICPPDQTVAFSAACDFILPDYTSLAVTSDNCDSDVIVTQSPAPGTVITANTTLTLTATDDAGNAAACTFQVLKTDLIAPDLTCPSDQFIPLDGDCIAVLADYSSLASATDNCGGLVTIIQSPGAGTVITATATITLTATDEAGNSTSCAFQAVPADQAAPVVTCPGNQQTAVTGDCDFVLQDYLGLVAATDN
ncbi:MAG: HYR domain-containing protein, partial [Flavobacteriales bacterium]